VRPCRRREVDARRELLVDQREHAALAGREVLVGVEAEARDVAHRADLAAVRQPGLRGVRGVLDELQPVLGADGLERDEIARMPGVVHGMTARVRGVTAAATAAGSMQSVSGSTSTNTGRAPARTITLAVAGHVSGVVMTSSSSPPPTAERPQGEVHRGGAGRDGERERRLRVGRETRPRAGARRGRSSASRSRASAGRSRAPRRRAQAARSQDGARHVGADRRRWRGDRPGRPCRAG